MVVNDLSRREYLLSSLATCLVEGPLTVKPLNADALAYTTGELLSAHDKQFKILVKLVAKQKIRVLKFLSPETLRIYVKTIDNKIYTDSKGDDDDFFNLSRYIDEKYYTTLRGGEFISRIADLQVPVSAHMETLRIETRYVCPVSEREAPNFSDNISIPVLNNTRGFIVNTQNLVIK